MTRKPLTLPDLPPQWGLSAPYLRSTHNGGPPLKPRSAGRTTISTPESRERILELLWEGIPLRAICRTPGLPCRGTVYGWRRADPEFDRVFGFMAQEGRFHLLEVVSEECDGGGCRRAVASDPEARPNARVTFTTVSCGLVRCAEMPSKTCAV